MDAPAFVAEVMESVGVWWAFAGGWAIDLWLGQQTRDHHDVEVVVRRSDQRLVHARLSATWDLLALDPPQGGWQPWDGAPISPPAFQLQARSERREFDIFTEDVDDKRWHFRRDHRISSPADWVALRSSSGLPIVRPEIQLLYMAKLIEPKNTHDFQIARPHLSGDAAAWLAQALHVAMPEHHWLEELG